MRLGKPAVEFFRLKAECFPEVTRTILPTSQILKFGALPLGFKTRQRFFKATKVLNIGFLNPSDSNVVQEVEKRCHERLAASLFSKIQVYRLLPDEFIDILSSVYHVDEASLRRCPPNELDSTLVKYLIALPQTETPYIPD